MNKAVFLDRDGTIIKDKSYMYKINQIEFFDKTFEGLEKFQKNGYLLIIITNQSGVAKGMFTKKQALMFNKSVVNKLLDSNIAIKDTFFCFHNPKDNCECRKPKQKLLFEAVKKYNIDLSKSVVIGDKESDVLMSKNTKLKSILISDKKVDTSANFIVADLSEAFDVLHI